MNFFQTFFVYSSHLQDAVVNANEITALNINGKESLWIDRGWHAADTDKDSGLSEAKLLGSSNVQSNYTDGGTDYAEVDTRNLSSFYNCRKVSFTLEWLWNEIYFRFVKQKILHLYSSHRIIQLPTPQRC